MARKVEPAGRLTLVKRDGIAYVENAHRRYLIVTPSRMRAPLVVDHPLFPFLNVVVHESELDEYAATFKSLGVEPGSLRGHNAYRLPGIHNWTMDNVWPKAEGHAEWIMLSDDDIVGLAFKMTHSAPGLNLRTEPQTICDIDCNLARMAQDCGAGMFGYVVGASQIERNTFAPLGFRALIPTGHCGIFDTTVRWDARLCEYDDYDYSLRQLCAHRIVMKSLVYSLWTNETGSRVGSDVGGQAGVRTVESMKEAVQMMLERWGEEVIRPRALRRGAGYTMSVRVPIRYKTKMVRK